MTSFRVGSASDVGQVRSNNQDSKLVGDGVEVYAVADGMGGHQGGEVASAIAVETLEAVITEPTTASVVEAVKEANRRIFSRASDSADLRGMGTTLVAIALVNKDADDEEVVWVNVGDSRAYLLRDGELHQLSRDHSLVEDLKRGGQLSEEEAAVHPQRNILTRALGIDVDVEVDTGAVEPWQGDRFLLCSDGLFNEVDRPTLVATLAGTADPDEAATELVRLANAGGGRDNITCVVADVVEDGGRAERAAAVAAAAAASAAAGRAATDEAGPTDATAVEGLDAPTAEMPAVDASAPPPVDDAPTAVTPGPPPPPASASPPTPPVPGPPPPPPEVRDGDAADAADAAPPAGRDADATDVGPVPVGDPTEPVPVVGAVPPPPGRVPADGPFPTPSDPGFPSDDDGEDNIDLPFGRESEDPFDDIQKARRGHWILVVLGTLVVLAVLVGGAYLAGSWYANRTYFLDTRSGDVVIMRGQPGGFVVFDPSLEEDLEVPFEDLDEDARLAVEQQREFDSLADARSFVRNRTVDPDDEPTTSSTTTTTEADGSTTTTTAGGSTTTTAAGGGSSTTAPPTTKGP